MQSKTRSPAGCHSGLIISQPVSSGRVALLPVVTDTQTKGEATLRRQERCTFHVLITSSHTAISDSQLTMSCQITHSVDDHFLQIYIFDMSFLFVYLAKSLLTRSCYFKGQAQGLGWFLTRYPLNFAWNNDVGEIVILLKQAFSVVPKASP